MKVIDKYILIAQSAGNLFYEYLRDTKRIIKENDNFKVVEKKDVIDTQWTRFWFTEKSFILIEKGGARKRGSELISLALTGAEGNIMDCEIDIDRLFSEYPLQWFGAFKDREGNIQRGNFFGVNIIEDDEMGEAYTRTLHKNQVGFITNYFGPEIKVRITRRGYIQVHANLEEEMDKVFEFLRDEISTYIIEH